MYIRSKVFNAIKETVGEYDVEAGGILGMRDGVVDQYYFDGPSEDGMYIPNVCRLNRIIENWYDNHITFIGIVHSHTSRKTLSYSDIEYARDILLCNEELKKIYMTLYVKDSNLFLTYCVDMKEVKLEEIITI